MLKKILLPLDPSPYTECATDFAISLAKIYDAEITGLVILDIEGIKSAVGPIPPGAGFYAKELENTKIDTAKVHIQNLLSTFKSKCDAAGVRHKESNAQGSPSKRIAELSPYYDLIVTGIKNQYHFETSDKFTNTIDSLLGKIAVPVIACPDKYSEFNSDSEVFKVIIAYNGSLQSIRAMQNFAKLDFPKEIDATVFISSDDDINAENMFQNIKSYLNAHKIKKVNKLITSKDKISVFNEELLNSYDIIVLGVHSRSGIFEFLIGSLTKHLIDEDKTMLFLSE
jgi:nucleotide-binding universal stress UspA family protein